MSDDIERLSPDDEQDLKAAEYVMGLLAVPEARAVEALALHDLTMADSIAAWETRLAPMAALVDPRDPPGVLWQRLALATGIDSVIRAPVRTRERPVRRTWPWQAATAAAMALAASFGFLLINRPVPAAPLVAALSPYGGPGATYLVRVGANGDATVVAVGNTAVPAGRALQLWAVAGTAAPVSMGLLPASGRAQLTIPVQNGTQLLVSQEPAGGSPSAGPTGPVVYAGTLTGI